MSNPPNDQGFKQLSPENWLTVDPAWAGVIMSSSRANPSEAWVNDLVEVELGQGVPQNVRKLFAVARGSMAYSLMFYPLLTLGTEQLYRVIETAVSMKCAATNAPPLSNFRRQIDWLASRGTINSSESSRWIDLVHLRNEASHPSDQKIYSPGMCLRMLDVSAQMINGLFAE